MKNIKNKLLIGLYIISLIPYLIYISITSIVYLVVWGMAQLLVKSSKLISKIAKWR